ncbi:MAG: type IV pilus twitching motility protein PilT [Myxococcota bacterium]
MRELDRLLKKMVEMKASDLHIVIGLKPVIRLHGDLVQMQDENVVTAEFSKHIIYEVMNENQRRIFEQNLDFDFAHEIPGLSRFRCNVLNTTKGVQGVFRIIPTRIKSVQELGLPETILKFAELRQGLVLVTGPTGSGKSTTLAAIIDHINQNREAHIITIEDPIEFVHQNKKSVITHREVGTHVSSFVEAIKAAGREDPDIILVGELRDTETISIAISTASFGILVLATLHTNSAAATIDRIIDSYAPEEQPQVRNMLSDSLKGVISQQLLKTADGQGRIAAVEVLFSTPALANLIREGKTFQVPSLIQTGQQLGMQSMDQCLYNYVKKGIITAEAAFEKALDKPQFIKTLEKEGIKINIQ